MGDQDDHDDQEFDLMAKMAQGGKARPSVRVMAVPLGSKEESGCSESPLFFHTDSTFINRERCSDAANHRSVPGRVEACAVSLTPPRTLEP